MSPQNEAHTFHLQRVVRLEAGVDRARATDGSVFVLRRVHGFEFDEGDSLVCRVASPGSEPHADTRLIYRGTVDRTDGGLVCCHGYEVRFAQLRFEPDSRVNLEFALQ